MNNLAEFNFLFISLHSVGMNGLSYLLNILICHETLKLVSLSGMFMDHERPFQLVELLSHFLENMGRSLGFEL